MNTTGLAIFVGILTAITALWTYLREPEEENGA